MKIKVRFLSVVLSVVLILTLVSCATNPTIKKFYETIPADETTPLSPSDTPTVKRTLSPSDTPTTEPTPLSPSSTPTMEPTPPTYLGEFRDMSVQQFISEFGPGYTNTSLVHFDPTVGYDSYLSIPIWLDFGLNVIDHDEYNFHWKARLSLGTTVNVTFRLEDLPDTPTDLHYNGYDLLAGVESWQDIPMKIQIENARIELPETTIELTQNNGIFDVTALDSTRYSRLAWLFVGLGQQGVTLDDLPETPILKKGTFKADVTLLEAEGPSKADYYTDKGLREFEPVFTSEWFSFLKSQGFNSIRFQVTWFNHTNDETYKIDQAWLQKVEEKINLALENDLYVSINLNWDMQPHLAAGMTQQEKEALPSDHAWLTLDGNPKVEERFASVWKQIAEYFKDYDEHLIFESINEPLGTDETMDSLGATGDPNGRGWSDIKSVGDNLNRLNQIFVDSVRSTGGNNAKRFLFTPPFFSKANYLNRFELPNDPAQHVIVCLNYYQGDFSIGGGDPFPNIKKYLTNNHIAAVFTEFGSDEELYSYDEIVNFVQESAVQARELNVPIVWFAGGWGNAYKETPDSSLFNPYNYEIVYPDIIDILMNRNQ